MGQVLVIGLVEGTIFGLFAVAITLVYRGTGAINFALGEIGTVGAYGAWWIAVDHGLPWIIGAAWALIIGAAISVAFEWCFVRTMKARNPLAISVASVGLLTFLLSGEFLFLGESPRDPAVAIHGAGKQIFGVFVSPTQMLSIVVIAAVALGLGQFLRRTDFGLGVLAAAQDPDATRLVGVPLRRVTVFVWAAGGALAALAALFVAPSVGVLSPGFASTHIFVVALVAAVVGGLSSLQGAFVGGLAVGLLKTEVLHVWVNSNWPGREYLVYMVIVVVMLLVRPNGLFSGVKLREAA